jgi:hypothetical protein
MDQTVYQKHLNVTRHLGLEVTMYVSQFVQLGHCCEHLTNVESSVFFLEDSGVVE